LVEEELLRNAEAVGGDSGRHLSDEIKKNKMACNVLFRNYNYCIMRRNFIALFNFKTTLHL
jgi:hypothetical protein